MIFYRSKPEAVGVRLQRSRDSLLDDVGTDVEILELGVASVGVDDERVLFDDSLLLLLLRLASFKLLLDVFDESERRRQVSGWRRQFA